MTKRYREPVDVELDGAGEAPAAFRWRGGRYRVRSVLGFWREDGGRWVGGGIEIPQRDLWRVEAQNGRPGSGIYELVHEGGAWRLDRVWD